MLRRIPDSATRMPVTSLTQRLALLGGSIQVLVAMALFFLPVFATCYLNEPDCRRQSYLQMGGTTLGYALLMGMIVVGVVVIINSLRSDRPLMRHSLWLAVVCSFVTLILGAWSIELAFLPGGALLLMATFVSRQDAA